MSVNIQKLKELIKIWDGTDGPVKVIDSETWPESPDYALVTIGQQKIFDSDGNPINDQNPLPVQPILGAAGKVFSAAVDAISAGGFTSDNPIFLLLNPTGSGKIIRGVEITTGVVEQNRSGKWNFHLNPTLTDNGTALTEVNLDQTSATASGAEAYSVPTISASGVLFNTVVNGQNANSSKTGFNQAVILGEGDSLFVTVKPDRSNAEVTVTVVWTEVDA